MFQWKDFETHAMSRTSRTWFTTKSLHRNDEWYRHILRWILFIKQELKPLSILRWFLIFFALDCVMAMRKVISCAMHINIVCFIGGVLMFVVIYCWDFHCLCRCWHIHLWRTNTRSATIELNKMEFDSKHVSILRWKKSQIMPVSDSFVICYFLVICFTSNSIDIHSQVGNTKKIGKRKIN